MVYGTWSVAQTKNQLQSPKLRTPVAPSCLRLSHSMMTSWSAGRPRLSELLVPSRLPCLRKSRFLSGTVRMTLYQGGNMLGMIMILSPFNKCTMALYLLMAVQPSGHLGDFLFMVGHMVSIFCKINMQALCLLGTIVICCAKEGDSCHIVGKA